MYLTEENDEKRTELSVNSESSATDELSSGEKPESSDKPADANESAHEDETESKPENTPEVTEAVSESNPEETVLPIKSEKPKKPKKEHRVKTFTAVLIAVCAAFLAAVITCQTTFLVLSQVYENKIIAAYKNVSDYSELFEVADRFSQDYIYNINQDAINEALIDAYIEASGDKYARYYNAEEWAELVAENSGNSSGIGVYVVNMDSGICVAHVMVGSPAEKAELKDGDVIVAIDGQRVSDIGYEKSVLLVAGETGTQVQLTILRDGQESVIDVTRGSYEAETVISSVVTYEGEKFGYLKITEFMNITVSQFKNAVSALLAQKCQGLIFDVRDNPGGQLDAIVSILDYLLPEGPIVHITDVDGKEVQLFTSDASETDCPMVVLANANTASAAELFTSSLKDYKKATVVGVKTYGKGCGQSGKTLSGGGVLYVTSFLYNSPYSANFDNIGIYPDKEVEMTDEYKKSNLFLVPHDADTQLQAALDEIYRLSTIENNQ